MLLKPTTTIPNPGIGNLCIITNDSKLHMRKLDMIPASLQAKDILNNQFPANSVGKVSRGGEELAGGKQEREGGSSQQQPPRLAS